MSINRDTIQAAYDAFGRGDPGPLFGAFTPETVWMEAEGSPYADRNPYVGAEQVGAGVFGRLMADWDGFALGVETLVADGDMVVALGRYRGTHRATGLPLDAQFAHAWTLRDGRVTRFQQYTDTAQYTRIMHGSRASAETM